MICNEDMHLVGHDMDGFLLTNLVFFRRTPFGPTTWGGAMECNSISHLLKNVLPYVGVHCRKWIVEEVEILVGIHSPAP